MPLYGSKMWAYLPLREPNPLNITKKKKRARKTQKRITSIIKGLKCPYALCHKEKLSI